MDLSALRTELQARGGARLESGVNTRTDMYLNRAYLELSEEEDWPWLLTSISGAAPLTITDLRTIESVVVPSTQTKLIPVDPRDLTDSNISLTTTGSAYGYYVVTGTTKDVAVYPVSTASITVRYWKVPAVLVNTTDTPGFPSRFHNVIVDQAMRYVYLDADQFDAAAAIQSVIDETKVRMRDALLEPQHDQPDQHVVSVVDHADATW